MKRRLLATLTLWTAAAGAVRADDAPIRVGPRGDYARIGDAVAAALSAGGTQVVKVARGRFVEKIDVVVPRDVQLTISGGWNDTFTSRDWNSGDPGDASRNTVVAGPAADTDPVLLVSAQGRLDLVGLAITGPGTPVDGGTAALRVYARGAAQVALTECAVWRHHYRAPSPFGGSGFASIEASNSAHVTLRQTVFAENTVESTETNFASGGLEFFVLDDARVDLLGSEIRRNVARASAQANTAALDVFTSERGTVRIEDSHITDNRGESKTEEWGPAGGRRRG